jgi:hypothetical protein
MAWHICFFVPNIPKFKIIVTVFPFLSLCMWWVTLFQKFLFLSLRNYPQIIPLAIFCSCSHLLFFLEIILFTYWIGPQIFWKIDSILLPNHQLIFSFIILTFLLNNLSECSFFFYSALFLFHGYRISSYLSENMMRIFFLKYWALSKASSVPYEPHLQTRKQILCHKNLKYNKHLARNCRSVVEYLPRMHKALSLSPSTSKKSW